MIEWTSAFDKLQKIPNKDIDKILRLSFDALDDDEVKNIFLDIACFFIGMDKGCVINILNGCGFHSEIGISVLTSRCLLRIENNKLKMHDLVRDMRINIVREESPKEPGKRSRLWFHEDVCDVLQKHKGTEAIEGINLILAMLENINLSTKAFQRMDKLRLLQMSHVHLTGSFEHLSEKLRWLCWHYYPLKYLPSNFHPESLVALDMQYSNFNSVWQGKKILKNLKHLNLCHSKCLTNTPDFTGIPRLETLLLEGCTNLVKIHPSIGLLDRLVYLNLKECQILRDLPSSICKLKSLELLHLTGCSNLEQLPEHLGNMEALKELLADGTAIKQLPFSFGLLKSLTKVSLQGCNRELSLQGSWLSVFSSWIQPRRSSHFIRFLPSSISGLCSLRELILSNCSLSDADIQVNLGSLSSLEILNLGGNNFRSLPSSLSQLLELKRLLVKDCRSLQSIPELPPNLEGLWLDDCRSLQSIPELPPQLEELWLNDCRSLQSIPELPPDLKRLWLNDCRSLQSIPELSPHLDGLHADGCTSLEKLGNLSNFKKVPVLFLHNCNRLAEIPGLENLDSIRGIYIEGCSNLATTFKDSFFKDQSVDDSYDIILPLSEIPDWFSHQRIGSSITFDMPLHVEDKFIGMTLWAVYAADKESDRTNGVEWMILCAVISDQTNDVEWTRRDSNGTPATRKEHTWVSYIPKGSFKYPIKGGERMQVSFPEVEAKVKLKVKMCGIHLVLKQDIKEDYQGQSSRVNADAGGDDEYYNGVCNNMM